MSDIWWEKIFMVLFEKFFKAFTNKAISNTVEETEVILALSFDSKFSEEQK